MGQIEKEAVVLEFRTPQHPSLGTNNWGGASPLLARNVPKESLEQKYTRLNSTRTRDEIFPSGYDQYHHHDDQSQYSNSHTSCASNYYDEQHGATAKRSSSSNNKRGRGILFKLFRRREKTATLGSSSKKIRMRRLRIPRLDPKTRWPNGWC